MLRYLLFAAALAATLARAAAAPPAPSQPDTLEAALRALSHQVRNDATPPAHPLPLTEAERAALKTVFGSEQPVRHAALPAAGARKRDRYTLPAGQYEANGATARWDAAAWTVTERDGNRREMQGTWPLLELQGLRNGPFGLTMKGLAQSAREQRTRDGLWLGSTTGSVDSFAIRSGDTLVGTFDDLRFDSVVSVRGKRMDQRVALTARRFAAAGAQLDDLRFAYSVANLDRATMARLTDDPKAAVAALRALVLAGAELKIDDFSARFHGHTARLHGTVAMPGATEDDFKDPQRVLRKVAARLDIAVPLPLLRELADEFARRQQNRQAVSADQLYEGMLGKAVGNGYARIEGNLLLTTIEWRDGKLLVNGHAMDLPKGGPATPGAPPPLDTSVPVPLTMAERKPDDLLAFALNGFPEAIGLVCRQWTAAGRDDAQAWCAKDAAMQAATQALLAGAVERDGPSLTEGANAGEGWLRIPAGGVLDREFRYDPRLRRELTVTVDTMKADPKWLPLLSVCVGAEAPSEKLCLSFASPRAGAERLAVYRRLQPAGVQGTIRTDVLAPIVATGEAHRVTVYTHEDFVVFLLDGERVISEPVGFPIQTLSVTCSTADCHYRFETAQQPK